MQARCCLCEKSYDVRPGRWGLWPTRRDFVRAGLASIDFPPRDIGFGRMAISTAHFCLGHDAAAVVERAAEGLQQLAASWQDGHDYVVRGILAKLDKLGKKHKDNAKGAY